MLPKALLCRCVAAFLMQGIGCNCDPSAVEEGWRGYAEMRRRPAPRGFVREQKGARVKQCHEQASVSLHQVHRRPHVAEERDTLFNLPARMLSSGGEASLRVCRGKVYSLITAEERDVSTLTGPYAALSVCGFFLGALVGARKVNAP